MLKEKQITDDGRIKVIDKVQLAIDRIIGFNDIALSKSALGYYVGVSGGKDSTVLAYLFYLAKQQCPSVKYELHHNHTTMDASETVYFIRTEQKYWQDKGIAYIINKPLYKGEQTSIYRIIAEKGVPTRFRRWCCEIFKEGGGFGRCCAFGVRWQESVKRKGRGFYEIITPNIKERVIRNNDNEDTRKTFETCQKYDKYAFNPIINWSNSDIWEFIKVYNLAYNPLYDKGYKRVGCVGCPLGSNMRAEFNQYPKIKANYIRACQNYINKHRDISEKFHWKNGQDMFDWWVSGKRTIDINQLTMFDDIEEVGE